MLDIINKGTEMNKNYILGVIIAFILIGLFTWFIYSSDKEAEEMNNAMMPRIGQKLWTYNMNAHAWKKYNQRTDMDDSKDIIILQVQEPVGSGGYTSYHLLTGNAQVPKEDVWVGEGSQEFLVGKKLYSYFPKTFEFYELIFNGVNFKPRKLSKQEISTLFKSYEIIDVSKLEKGTLTLGFSKHKNEFLILNDSGDDFYKYYIIPNESKKMEIGEYSNQFKVKDKVQIKIQRLEGCSKAYPCYEINFK